MPAITTSHIPDPALITHYSEHVDSFCTRASPWTKVALLLLLVIVVTVSANPLLAGALFAITIGVYVAAGLPLRRLASWLVFPSLFLLSLTGFLVFSSHGEPGVPLPGTGLSVTLTGLLLCGSLLARALAVVTASLVFVMTTRHSLLAGLASRILPSPLDTLLLLAYRYLFSTRDVLFALIQAAKSRGGGIIRQIPRHWRMWAALIAVTLLRSYERAERVTCAMESRGFKGSFPIHSVIPPPGRGGILLLLFGICLTGGVVIWLP